MAVAQADLWEQWQEFPLEDAVATRSALTVALTDTAHVYGEMAAGAGADWYVEARREAVPGRFSARLSVPVSAEQITVNAGWAVGPLFGVAQPETAFKRASGVAQKLIANADRATILGNIRRDPKAQRWSRGASANCCTFCAMLATRDNYRSESSAGFKAHGHCRCFPVPVWRGEAQQMPDYYDTFAQEYADAVKAVDDLGERRTPKTVLREMRALSGRA